ncbi:MAG: PSD1 and planctomycete cytochrome C domain-containing protein [Verrucomicrobiales bacterium]
MVHKLRRFLPARKSLVPLFLLAVVAPLAAADLVPQFNRDIRPILSENCFACHGPDEKTLEAGLRLDRAEFAIKTNSSGEAAIVSGHPERSLLLQRVKASDPDDKMPPHDTGKVLSKHQIELLEAWIKNGAEYQSHWAYRKPARPAPPATESSLIKNDIDRFVTARLREDGLEPSPEADKITLLRRLSFDIRGLPPTPQETKAFLDDNSPNAYEKWVDQFLASPQYGERMAMYWLDLVRYADTDGYHGDQHRNVYPYRDYVINAFNNNKPFDQFTVEQLAGDLLPEAGWEQKIASGYNRMLMTTREGGAQPKEYLAKYSADRVRNVSTVWLASTMGCSECHDHKFDPFSAKDFYTMAAFFADIQEVAVGDQPETPAPTTQQQRELEQLQASKADLERELYADKKEWQEAQAAWEKSSLGWIRIAPQSASGEQGSSFILEDDDSIFVSKAAARDVYTITAPITANEITGIRMEILADERLPKSGPGRAFNGNFVLNELELWQGDKKIELARATATHSQGGFPIAHAIDGKAETGWAILDHIGRDNEAALELKSPLNFTPSEPLQFKLRFNYGTEHNLGKIRFSYTTNPKPIEVLQTEIRNILAKKSSDRSPEEAAKLMRHFRSIAPELEPIRQKLAGAQKAITDLERSLPRTLITVSTTPREIRILPRGNWLDETGEVVSPEAPHFINPISKKERANRLDLARWMVSEENPLVARVFVNRLWKNMFGYGIVRTADDFGSQGSWPTHLDLLDWLAVEFRENGWDIKKTIKLIAMSHTYRQTSNDNEHLRLVDPYNKLLARQGRFRLEAEMVRDNALAIAGLLQQKLGGPSVKPYQPAGYWAYLNFPMREWQADSGPDLYRRGLYTYWCRTYLQPSMLAFDAPTREECTVERVRSNTPQQALALLNDPTYVEAARVFAERILRDGGKDFQSRLNFACNVAFSRLPKTEEATLLKQLLEKEMERFGKDQQAAADFLSVGEWKAATDFDKTELAAWASIARAILNLHETLTRS